MEQKKEWRFLIISLSVLICLVILFLLFKLSPYLQLLFSFVQGIVGPFVIAMIISYLLNPIVNILSQRGLSRWIAVLFIYSLFIASLVVLLMNLLPLINQQLNELLEHVPHWNHQMQYMIREYNDHSKEILPSSVQNALQRSLNQLEQGIGNWVSNFLDGIGQTLNHLFIAVVIPFLAFYMMRDSRELERGMMNLFPRNKRREMARLFRDMDLALGNYIRGQLLVGIVVGVLIYGGYSFIGLPYPLILAGIVAMFNVVPYLGPFLGAIPALLVALTLSPKMFLAVLMINFVVQIIEGNILSPQIVGRTLHMHPLTIIFALLVGGEFGGVWGLIFAVPLFAVGKVIFQHITAHFVRIKV